MIPRDIAVNAEEDEESFIYVSLTDCEELIHRDATSAGEEARGEGEVDCR